MVHLLPHWNFAGHEGRIINVWAYTNAPFVELFLNGASLGKLAIEKHGHGEWQVAYTPGVIEAVAYDENGKEIARDKKVTSGKPYALKLSMDTPNARPNGKDVAIMTCYVVDKDGNEVYDACPTVRFSANGSGKILSTGSDVTDHEPLFLPYRRMRAGRIGVAVKMLNSDKPLTVIAEADGINTAVYYDSFGKTSDFSLKFEQELAPVQEDAKSTGKPV